MRKILLLISIRDEDIGGLVSLSHFTKDKLFVNDEGMSSPPESAKDSLNPDSQNVIP